MKNIIKELRKAGFITLARIQDAKGQVVEWRYDVYDTPLDKPVKGQITVRLDDDTGYYRVFP